MDVLLDGVLQAFRLLLTGDDDTWSITALTLRVAAEKAGYTLADRGTYLSQPDGLAVLVEGDPGLLNVYHVIEMTPRAGERVQPEGAAAFADWITGTDAQQRIGEFGRAEYGQPLFVPDAAKPDPTG